MAMGPVAEAFLQQECYGPMELDRVEGGPAFRRLMKGTPKEGNFLGTSAAVFRALNFNILRYRYALRGHYFVTVFRVATRERGQDYIGKQCVYAIAYWLTNEDVKAEGRDEDTLTPEFICLGGTYVSQDGEYRENFLQWDEFERNYAEALRRGGELEEDENLVANVEAEMVDLFEQGELDFSVSAYPFEETNRLDTRADELRMPIKLLTASVILLMYQRYAAHLMPLYAETMSPLIGDAEPLMRRAQPDLLVRTVQAFRNGSFTNNTLRVAVGQKLLPLMRAAAVDFNNIRYPTPREVWVSEALSDFKLNGRSNAFPYVVQWTTVRDVAADMFDNEALTRLYETSLAATDALNDLQRLRQRIAGTKKGKRNVFEGFDHELYRSVAFAEEHMIMSDIALVLATEWVGRTVGSLKLLSLDVFEPAYGGEGLMPVLFELAYGCLAMHDLCVHSDLHYHNMTVQTIWLQPSVRKKYGTDQLAYVYLAGPTQADAYVVPARGVGGRIIDFSRALVNPARRSDVEQHQGVGQATAFFEEQIERTVKAIERWEPAFVETHRAKIYGAAHAEPQALYEVIAALDYLALGRNFKIMLEELPPELAATVAPAVGAACERMRAVAHDELIRGLQKVALQRAAPDRSARDIGRRVLSAAFPDNKFTAWDEGDLKLFSVTDVFNVAAPLKYSGQALDRFPPWADLGAVAKLAGMSVEKLLPPGDGPMLAAADSRASSAAGHPELELLIERERSQLARRPPPEAGTSWIT